MQSVQESREWFDDLDLLLATQILAESFDQKPAEFSRLTDFVQLWRNIPRAYGPGTIDLRLADLASDPTIASEFVALTHRAEHLISSVADPIPAEVANSRWGVSGVTFYDYGAARLVDTLHRLRGLLLDFV